MSDRDKSVVFEIPEDRVHDSREQEPRFQRLPEEEKEGLREIWRFSDRVLAEIRRRRRTTTRRYVIESGLLFLILVPFRWEAIVIGVPLGMVCGFLAARLRAGTMLYGWIGGFGYACFMLATGWINPFALVLACFLSGLLGLVHGIQRADRTEI